MLTSSDAYLFGAAALLLLEVFLLLKKVPFRRNLLYAALLLYVTLVFSVTLFPIPYQLGAAGSDYAYNFIPLRSIADSLRDGLRPALRSIAANVVMFLPFGVLLPLISKKNRFWRCVLYSLLFSLFIELLQYLIGLQIGYRYRNVDVDDLLLNTLGGGLGALLLSLVPQKLRALFQ